MRNEIKKMMQTVSTAVAGRIGAEPAEVLEVMQTEWEKAGSAERRRITAYLKKQSA